MTEIRGITPENFEDTVRDAAAVLARGGVILYPTDTLYGLGVDSLNPHALEKLYVIKERDQSKFMHNIVADLDTAKSFAELTPLAHILVKKFLPGPLTLILNKKESVPNLSSTPHNSFGIRIPHNALCLAIAHTFGKPFTATSANISGQETLRAISEILSQLGSRANAIDLVIDAGTLPLSLPSTIIDVRSTKPLCIREGAIPFVDILATISENS